MAEVFNMDVAEAQACIDDMMKCTGPDILGQIDHVAMIAKDLDDNQLTQTFGEAGMKYQQQYNTFIDNCVTPIIEELRKVEILDQYIKKLDVNLVQNRDTSAVGMDSIPLP